MQNGNDHKQKHSMGAVAGMILSLLGVAGLSLLGVFLFLHQQKAVARMELSLQVDGVDWDNAIYVETEPETQMPFAPCSVEKTRPEDYIAYTQIEQNGTLLEDPADFSPWYDFDFSEEGAYTAMDGVITFRGNNLRSAPAFGTAHFSEDILTGSWSVPTGGLTYQNATWTGSGWTGQPLITSWPRQMRAHMNMYDWAREQETLTEVIYACMDGYVYFLDLATGEKTRDPLYLGFTFKGAGALDPRGYPILYLGAGYDSNQGRARVFIVNLLDLTTLYTFGNEDPFSLRGNLSYFDSSPLVDAASDTLIYPGENGILYLIRLNTRYDPAAGTLTMEPTDVVKWRYMGLRTSLSSYWLGMESSAAIFRNYLFITDNGGNLMCLDLNTLQLVWVKDILDDSNGTPVLAVEDGKLYLYVSTSFHLGWRSSSQATVPVWKIDASTGETVWQRDYECYSQEGVSGGVQSTVALGSGDLANYVYVTVARTGDPSYGVLSCIDRRTGAVVWEHKAIYAWSSPVCVYNQSGEGRVLYCSCNGNMYLLDGKEGEVLFSFALSNGAIEASPAVYENHIVVGTRASRIWGLELQ